MFPEINPALPYLSLLFWSLSINEFTYQDKTSNYCILVRTMNCSLNGYRNCWCGCHCLLVKHVMVNARQHIVGGKTTIRSIDLSWVSFRNFQIGQRWIERHISYC